MRPCDKDRIAYNPVVIDTNLVGKHTYKFHISLFVHMSMIGCPANLSLTASPKKTQPMKMQRLSLTCLHIQNGYRLDDFRHGNPIKQIHYSHATK